MSLIHCQTIAQLQPTAPTDPWLTLLLAIIQKAHFDAANPRRPELQRDALLWLAQMRRQAKEVSGG